MAEPLAAGTRAQAKETAGPREPISLEFVSEVPSDSVSGPAGETYQLQLAAQRAEWSYQNMLALAEEQARAETRPGSIMAGPDPYRHPEVIAARKRRDQALAASREAQSKLGGTVFCVAVDNLPEIRKRLDQLNRKAAKLGAASIELDETGEHVLLEYQYADDGERSYTATFDHVYCTLKGQTPKVPGYEFLASVTHTPAGNTVNRIPAIRYGIAHNLAFGDSDREDSPAKRALDAIDLTRFHDGEAICEHCGKRRARTDTFIVYDEKTGDLKQVGRSCLRDFTGANDPERILQLLEQYSELMRSAARSRGHQPDIPMRDYLAHVACKIRTQGFEPRSGGIGTADYAQDNYRAMLIDARDREGKRMYETPSEVDRQRAESVRAWALGEWDEDSEFARNVKVSVANDALQRKGAGYAAALFGAYDRAQNRQHARQQAQEQAQQREWVGEKGERRDFRLKLVRVRWLPGYMEGETRPLYIFEDEHGNELKWKASDVANVESSDPEERLILGDQLLGREIIVKGTVTGHEEHERFGKTTAISRCKVRLAD